MKASIKTFKTSRDKLILRKKILVVLASIFMLTILIPGISMAQNLISNPGFESGTISSPWGIWSGDKLKCSVSIDTLNANSGKYCAKVQGDLTLLQQKIAVQPNTKYKVSVYVKNDQAQAVYFGVQDYGGEKISRYFTATEYVKDSLYFTTNDTPNDALVFIWKQDGTGNAWVDNFSLVVDSAGTEVEEPGGLGNYYVSVNGSDSASGTSVNEAWKTIQKVNTINLFPGDVIHFEGRQTFAGKLILNINDSGTQSEPIKITSYGNGRATINGGDGTAVYVSGSKYVTFQNINLIGSGRKDGNTGNGMYLSGYSNITIDSMEVSGFQHSGITTVATGKSLRCTNVYAHDNGYCGIFISGIFGDKKSQSDIYLGYCTIDNNPGDPTVTTNHSGNGILVFCASDVLVEYCEASKNGWDMPWKGSNGPGGIWVSEVDNAVIQHCIAHDNLSSSSKDGVGFDLDGGTTNSIIQYCLSYNNTGSGYGIFQWQGATDWANNTIRYCISENDGNIGAAGSIAIWNGDADKSKFHGLEFYNNVVYNYNGAALAFVDHFNDNFNFRNNVFVSKDTSIAGDVNGELFQGNCWYSLDKKFTVGSRTVDFVQWAANNNQEKVNNQIVGIFADPKFVNPGKSTLTDPLKLTTITDYQVGTGSKVIDAGLDLKSLFSIDPGVRDYYGNTIKQGNGFDIGVYELPKSVGIIDQPSQGTLDFKISPNPSNDGKVRIELQNSISNQKLSVNIFSIDGRLLISKNITTIKSSDNFQFSFDNSLKKGVYLISLASENKKIGTKKIIID